MTTKGKEAREILGREGISQGNQGSFESRKTQVKSCRSLGPEGKEPRKGMRRGL
jgi:hypothetical protein